MKPPRRTNPSACWSVRRNRKPALCTELCRTAATFSIFPTIPVRPTSAAGKSPKSLSAATMPKSPNGGSAWLLKKPSATAPISITKPRKWFDLARKNRCRESAGKFSAKPLQYEFVLEVLAPPEWVLQGTTNMNPVIRKLHEAQLRNDLPDFRAGDTVKVNVRLLE